MAKTQNAPHMDSLFMLLQKNKRDDLNRAYALEDIINALFAQRNYHQAKPLINELSDLSEKLSKNYVKVLACYYRGTVLLTEDQYKQAINYLLRAKKLSSILSSTKKNIKLQILIYSALSVSYFKSQMFKEFYENIQKGLELNEKLQDADLEFILRTNLAVTYRYIGKGEAAIEIDKMLTTDPLYANQNMYYPFFHLGVFNMDIHNYDSALVYFSKAYSYAILSTDVAWILLKKGIIYNIQGHYYDALNTLTRCLDSIKGEENAEIEAYTHIQIGYSYYKLQKKDTAISLIDKGIEKARNHHYLEIEVEGLGLKSEILYEQGQYKKFAYCIKKYNYLSDSLDTINNLNKLSEMLLQQKLNEEVQQFKYQQYILETKNRQQLLVFSFVLMTLLLIIIVILLLLNRKNINIKNKRIQQELLTKELDLRNREITARVLSQAQKKELLTDIIDKLTEIGMNPKAVKSIHSIIQELKQSSLEDDYSEEFNYYFVQIHPDFYDNLRTNFPNLTPNELRLCAYLKLNLSTKNIAAINNISVDSARVARTRLRKSLNLNNSNENLINFLSKY